MTLTNSDISHRYPAPQYASGGAEPSVIGRRPKKFGATSVTKLRGGSENVEANAYVVPPPRTDSFVAIDPGRS